MTVEWAPLSMDDTAELAGLMAAIEAEDRTGENHDADDLADELANPMVDLAEGTLIGREDGRPVAFVVLLSRPAAEPVHQMIMWGGVHPARRRRGLGRHLLDWAAGTAPVLHERRFPGQPLELHLYTDDRNEGARTLATGAGMAPARWFYDMDRDLARELPEAPLPDGLKIVPYREDLEDAVREVRNAAFADHWGSVPQTPESWRASLVGTRTFRPESSFVAVDDSGGCAGVLLTQYYEADTQATGVREAWIQIIGTLREWRGRGVASALIAHALAEFRAQGYGSAGLGVDADNPTGALGIYTRAGFEIEHRHTTYSLPLG
ncbi:GNAT family N-acetyltransferase [Planomonospora venezuelensis]|uniref:Mycothiol synthase n=1 Tax=Planomonospora venezuelensis TaxID=1999 RepID=A0A841CXD8_PLAVE|nr:GNAT family N-acetyltransferase [Planomonospora venezuelensis]MBB5960798.1 mycothiol synthase [Planomonospora venezuelensis]GIN03808.1 N-acetyltransferase [Planomonospora venezuelensis]